MAPKGKTAAAAADPPVKGLEVLTGGDGGEAGAGGGDTGSAPQPAGTPSLVTILINGKPHKVAPEVAQSITEEQELFSQERGRLARELKAGRPAGSDRGAEPPPRTPQRPSARLIYDGEVEEYDRQESEWFEHRMLGLENRIGQRISDGDSKRQSRRELDKFISRVGAASDSLEGENDLILSAMQRLAQRYPNDPMHFSDPRTLRLVVEEASSELTRLANKGKGRTAPKTPGVEGQQMPGGVGGGEPEPEDQKGPTSIAEIQRERRMRRLRGRHAAVT